MSRSVVVGRIAILLCAACGDDAGFIWPDGPDIDATPACPPITGPGVVKGTNITTPETWTAAESPHIIMFDTSIGAAVTIEKCAEVRIGGGKQVSIRAGGSINTHGEPFLPVTIKGIDTTPWVNIRTLNGGTLSLVHTSIIGGGDPQNGIALFSATLDIAGTTPATQPILHAEHVYIDSSESCGISLHDGGGFDDTSTDVWVTNALCPITTFARAIGTIPTGRYTDNQLDEIVVRATGGPEAIAEDATIHERGVPYRIGTQPNLTLDVGGVTGLATLTIEPGVRLRFAPGATMRIDAASGTNPARGALIAVGTIGAPIVFTSSAATPAAGDWNGVWFGGTVDATSRMDHTRVEFAGKQSSSGSDSCIPSGQVRPNDAAIRILGDEPATVFITNTKIVQSAFHGIDRGYRSDTKASYLPTNDFPVPLGGCKESYPRDESGACPTTVPCP